MGTKAVVLIPTRELALFGSPTDQTQYDHRRLTELRGSIRSQIYQKHVVTLDLRIREWKQISD